MGLMGKNSHSQQVRARRVYENLPNTQTNFPPLPEGEGNEQEKKVLIFLEMGYTVSNFKDEVRVNLPSEKSPIILLRGIFLCRS